MANSYAYQFRYSYQRDIYEVFMKVTFGATGAPTLTYGKGVTSIARISAGKYTITLKDKYIKLLMANKMFINATSPAAQEMYITADNSATGTIGIQFAAAGVATDPATGEVGLIQLCFQNAST